MKFPALLVGHRPFNPALLARPARETGPGFNGFSPESASRCWEAAPAVSVVSVVSVVLHRG